MSPKVEVSVIAVYVPDPANISFAKIPISKALAAKYPVVPLRLRTESGRVISIDRVQAVSRAASLKAGGLGDRYICLATLGDRQREIYLYKDADYWFLEEEF